MIWLLENVYLKMRKQAIHPINRERNRFGEYPNLLVKQLNPFLYLTKIYACRSCTWCNYKWRAARALTKIVGDVRRLSALVHINTCAGYLRRPVPISAGKAASFVSVYFLIF